MTPSRNDIKMTSPAAGAGSCPVCFSAFARVRRQTYCSPACRQAAWHHRQVLGPAPLPATSTGRRTRRRDVTVYRCGGYDQRYLGEQWCPDCQRPCNREGTGGLCPHCDEPVTVDDLLPQQQDQSPQN